jgi:hypothetical protein
MIYQTRPWAIIVPAVLLFLAFGCGGVMLIRASRAFAGQRGESSINQRRGLRILGIYALTLALAVPLDLVLGFKLSPFYIGHLAWVPWVVSLVLILLVALFSAGGVWLGLGIFSHLDESQSMARLKREHPDI